MRIIPTGFNISKAFIGIAFLVILIVVIYQLPVSMLSSILGNRTDCRVIFHQAQGTVWRGSAALGFSEFDLSSNTCLKPSAITERFAWQSKCSPGDMECHTEIRSPVLNKPVLITIGLGRMQVSSGEIVLPASILEAFGNPWKTLRPRGQLTTHWDVLKTGKETAGSIRMNINNLSSPISSIKPLGSYEIKATLTESGLLFFLTTVAGPLLLNGKGALNTELDQVIHFSGSASSTPENEESLVGLLSLLGKKDGDVYRMQY